MKNQLEIIQLANKMFKDSKPLDGELLIILKKNSRKNVVKNTNKI
jgi:hypothetical protein